ncbi:MAG TPA: SCO family protein [Chthoniobacterales bacterium]|nr:SCO family protein [Chthoniobacterales bacterium]
MKRSLPIVIVLMLVIAPHPRASVVDVEPQRGRAVTQIDWTDETNTTHNLSQSSGFPLVIVPIFTRCRTACVQNVAQLKKALADSSADPRQFRVLLFSFDATDTPAVLAKYRERESIPLGWSTGSASQPNIDALLDSIGFPVGRAGTQFTHPNMVLFLDSNLRVAQWIYGTDYSTRDVDRALHIASGGSSWIAERSEWLYSLLVFTGSLLCIALCYSLLQLRARRRVPIVGPAPL